MLTLHLFIFSALVIYKLVRMFNVYLQIKRFGTFNLGIRDESLPYIVQGTGILYQKHGHFNSTCIAERVQLRPTCFTLDIYIYIERTTIRASAANKR